jgi:hypothetical protein
LFDCGGVRHLKQVALRVIVLLSSRLAFEEALWLAFEEALCSGKDFQRAGEILAPFTASSHRIFRICWRVQTVGTKY